MTITKAPTVWKHVVDNIDASEKGGIRVGYEVGGRVQYVYLNEGGLQAILASRKSLEEANVKLAETQMSRAVSRKADQAFNKAYKMMFDLVQNDATARIAGEAARKAVTQALEAQAQSEASQESDDESQTA